MNMKPYSYIQKRTLEATFDAQRDGLRPALATDVIMSRRFSGRFNIPFLGDYVPGGWVKLDDGEVYVSTINGRSTSQHPTVIKQDDFRTYADEYAKRDEVYGFGVVEQGQFQVLISLYRKEEDGKKECNS